MKKLFMLLFTGVFLNACSSDDGSGDIMQILAPVVSVDMPEQFVFGSSYNIDVVYERPSNCHTFNGLDLHRNENEITVGVVTSFRTGTNPNCMTTGNLQATTTINFVAEREDFYIFHFWKGRNGAGRDEFLTIEVPVTRPGLD